MKTNCLLALPTLLLSVLFTANASLPPGCTVLSPPGTWSVAWSDGGDVESPAFGNGTNYNFVIGGFIRHPSDPSEWWDWLETCDTEGGIFLANTPGVPWYSPGDDSTLIFNVTNVHIKMRSTRYQATNSSYFEFEISAQTDSFTYAATVAGSLSIIRFPETPDALPYTVATVPIQQASLIVSPQLQITQPAPSQVSLSWPTNATVFLLESADSFPAGDWSTVTNAPTIGHDNQFNVTLPACEAMRIFRLRMQ